MTVAQLIEALGEFNGLCVVELYVSGRFPIAGVKASGTTVRIIAEDRNHGTM